MFCWCFCLVAIYVIYKILDRILRIPFVGNNKDRYILVTGCHTGFGNLLARRLDGLGCHVFAGCHTEKGQTELKKVSSDRLNVMTMDVTDRESVQKAFEFVKSKLPQGRGLWGILNNAGTACFVGQPDWMTLDGYKLNSEVNLWGLIDVTLTFLPLVKMEKGRVVNTTSILGRMTLQLLTPYCISKYGVEAFTDGLRRCIHAFGCKAILVEPGFFKTPLTSPEFFRNLYLRTISKMDPQIRAEYGEAYIEYLISQKGLEKLLQTTSDRVEDVVNAYEHALLGSFPRARYLVGKDANFIFMPIQWLPEWLGDWVLRKLNSEAPLPEAALHKKTN